MLSTDAFVWTCCVKILGKTKNIIVSGIIVELKRRRGGVYSFHFFEKSFDKKNNLCSQPARASSDHPLLNIVKLIYRLSLHMAAKRLF